MANVLPGRLAAPVTLGTTDTLVYQVPAGKRAQIVQVRARNLDTVTRTFDLYVNSDTPSNTVFRGADLTDTGTMVGDGKDGGIIYLGAGESLRGRATDGVPNKVQVEAVGVEGVS